MIPIRKTSLLWFATCVVAIVAAETANTAVENPKVAMEEEPVFVCDSICGNAKKGLSTPDLVVEYNWNPRVPVCAGLSCDSGTCSELERKLPSFQGEEADCGKHQTGLQEAGCECSGGGNHGSKWWMATTAAVATTVVTLLL